MKLLILLSILLCLTSCKDNDESSISLDRFYESFYSVNIYPALANFKLEIEKEALYVQQFKANKTKENFKKIQDQWLIATQVYSKAKIYNYVALKNAFFDINIYNYPVNIVAIENNILESIVYNTDYFKNKSSTNKGLATIEFLLYNNQTPEQAYMLLQQQNNRINYLLGVVNEVVRQSNLLISFWKDQYKNQFINSKNLTCANNARCLVFNQLINILDIIKVTKIGKPAGFEKSDNINPKSLEAFKSRSSLKLIKASLQEIEHVYSLSPINFKSIIDAIDTNKKLSKQIEKHFKEIYVIINAFDVSLDTAILNKDEKVKKLYDSLTILIRDFSVDGASLLSITILPTDNDGD